MTLLGAAVVMAGACSSGGSADKDPAAPTSTGGSAAATTTVPPVQPLTGLPVAAGGPDPARPALSVKVDNVDNARPQAGLNAADMVTEQLVEGGQTRLFVTYHSQDAASVGPIRSARPVDADLLRQLGGGLFAFSGAARGELAPVIEHSTSVLLSNDGGDDGFRRLKGRRAPHNLFGSTTEFYEAGAKKGGASGPPPRLFDYDPAVPAGSPAGTVAVAMGNRASNSWTFDAATGQWQRTQNGRLDVLDDGSTVTADNVLVMSVTIAGTGIFDTAGEEDPLVVVIGSGEVTLFRDGVSVGGTWERPSFSVPVKLATSAGGPMPLRPGRTWIELQPVPGRPVVS